jgi:hypothetical protein
MIRFDGCDVGIGFLQGHRGGEVDVPSRLPNEAHARRYLIAEDLLSNAIGPSTDIRRTRKAIGENLGLSQERFFTDIHASASKRILILVTFNAAKPLKRWFLSRATTS